MANSALAAQYNCSGELQLQLTPRQSVSQCSLPPAGLLASHSTTSQGSHQHSVQSADRPERTQHSADSPELPLLGWAALRSPEMDETSPGWIDLTVNCVKLSLSGRCGRFSSYKTQLNPPPGSPRKPVGEVAAVVSGPITAREDQKYKAEWRRAGQSELRF